MNLNLKIKSAFVWLLLFISMDFLSAQSIDINYDSMFVQIEFDHQQSNNKFLTRTRVKVVNKKPEAIYLPMINLTQINEDSLKAGKGNNDLVFSKNKIPVVSYSNNNMVVSEMKKLEPNDTVYIFLEDSLELSRKNSRRLNRNGYYFSLDFCTIDSLEYAKIGPSLSDTSNQYRNRLKHLPDTKSHFIYHTFIFKPSNKRFKLKEYVHMPAVHSFPKWRNHFEIVKFEE